MITFNKKYFLFFALLFIVEVLIALYIDDRIIRPFVGDFLVVILIYCFVKAFLKVSVISTAISVLLFAFVVEGLQYLHIVKLLGLQKYRVAVVVIGNHFQWLDILIYTLGIATVVFIEKRVNGLHQNTIL